ncbi:MAG: NAD(P)H-dependent oxidoreductase [Desulfobacteraceae bacterium]|nr:NAD(P)H-dependent oxidoreductase [Desulfobacteraceae bacterium]
MKNLIVFTHPYEKSYCSSILQHIVRDFRTKHQDVDIIDLYQEGFNPALDKEALSLYKHGKFSDPKVGKFQKLINESNHLLFIFPVWWYDLPAILKGFLDKVFLKDWAYEDSKSGLPKGKLTFIKKATVISTMKSPGWYYWLMYRNSIKQSFIRGTLKFCGIKKIRWINITDIENISDEDRKRWLKRISRAIGRP